MLTKTVTHPVKQYWVAWDKEQSLSTGEKRHLLHEGIKDLLAQGIVVLKAKYEEQFDVSYFAYRGSWYFTIIYVGRKTIHRIGIRHLMRKEYKCLTSNTTYRILKNA